MILFPLRYDQQCRPATISHLQVFAPPRPGHAQVIIQCNCGEVIIGRYYRDWPAGVIKLIGNHSSQSDLAARRKVLARGHRQTL